MSWKYVIKTGQVIDPIKGKIVMATGYAGGNKGKNPEGVNNPLLVAIKSVGPLPPGIYTMEKPIDPHPHLGRFAIPLTPDKDNVMFGRGDFFCHGDNQALNHSASQGCIILPRWVRDALWASIDHKIHVVAEA